MKTVIQKWSLSISNHQDKVFLQFDWETVPIGLKQTVRHLNKTFGRQFPEKTINEQTRSAAQYRTKNRNNYEVHVLEILD